jgi:ribonucleoside-diphosphate reductase alpha chain
MNLIAQKGTIRGMQEIPEDVQALFVTAHDIAPDRHIKMQAAFQRHTNNAVSKTVNLPKEATVEDVRAIYMFAYESGCKGATIYRDNSRAEQVLSKPQDSKDASSKSQGERLEDAPVKIIPRPRPNVTVGTTTKIATGCGNLYVTINVDEKGLPFEVFMSMGKAGGCAMSQLEALGRLVSLALRSGIEATAIIEQIRGIRCPSPSWEKGGRIFSCSDAIARVLERRLHGTANTKDLTDLPEKAKVAVDANMLTGGGVSKPKGGKKGDIVGVCPDCGSSLWHIEGCMVCNSCGYSKCG